VLLIVLASVIISLKSAYCWIDGMQDAKYQQKNTLRQGKLASKLDLAASKCAYIYGEQS